MVQLFHHWQRTKLNFYKHWVILLFSWFKAYEPQRPDRQRSSTSFCLENNFTDEIPFLFLNYTFLPDFDGHFG